MRIHASRAPGACVLLATAVTDTVGQAAGG
jgi:hypothetical protein